MESLKRKSKRAKQSLIKLGGVADESNQSTTRALPFAHLLDTILDFVEQDGNKHDDLIRIANDERR